MGRVRWVIFGVVGFAFSSALAALPDAAEQSKAQKLIRELYRNQYAQTAHEARAELAATLLAQARQTQDSAAQRYVLLTEARDLAAGAGDAATAVQALRALAEFDEDVVKTCHDLLIAVARNAGANQQEALARACLEAARQSVAADDYPSAERIAKLAQNAAGRAGQVPLAGEVQRLLEEIAALQAQYAECSKAMEALAANPQDPQANLAVGRYRALVQGNWREGLPMLAQCADATLSELARRDLAAPADPANQCDLASAWWELGETQPQPMCWHLRQRAAGWYRQAVSGLTGLNAEAARQRLSTVAVEELRRQNLEPGLIAELFAGEDFRRRVKVRIDPQILFDWGDTPADESLPKDRFSIRWSGLIKIASTGRHAFLVVANSGCRIQIDGRPVLDAPELWRKRGGERIELELTEGLHRLSIDFWDGAGIARMKLLWRTPQMQVEEPLTAEALCHEIPAARALMSSAAGERSARR